jgi:hypothetical protein
MHFLLRIVTCPMFCATILVGIGRDVAGLGGIYTVIVLLLLFRPLRGLVVGATDIDVSIFVSSASGGLVFHSRNCSVFYCRYIESPALEK